MVNNDIFPGFPWSQTFRFPAGTFLAGQILRADFRKNAAEPIILSLDENDGIVRAGDDFTLNLTAAQTSLMTGWLRVSFDFVRDAPGGDTLLGVRVRVPVTNPLAEPTP